MSLDIQLVVTRASSPTQCVARDSLAEAVRRLIPRTDRTQESSTWDRARFHVNVTSSKFPFHVLAAVSPIWILPIGVMPVFAVHAFTMTVPSR